MRENIIQLPATLSVDKRILLAAGPDPAIDSIRRAVDDLNRKDPWIQAEYRQDVPASKVTSKIGCVVMFGSISAMTIKQLRHTASIQGIPCPITTYTAKEARHVLNLLSDLRDKGREENPSANGQSSENGVNGSHTPSVNGHEHPEEPSEVKVETSQPDGFDIALSAVDDMMKVLENGGGHLVTIIDRCKAANARCKELEEMMLNKDRDYQTIQAENARLKEKNLALESKQSQILQGLEALGNLQKIAQGR